MKKLIFAVAALSVFVFACGKEDDKVDPNATYCWTCTVTTTVSGQADASQKLEQCDYTAAQIKKIETDGTSTTNAGGVTVKLTTKCTKK
ncbi:hypothetical protein MKQ70_03470 [Chitinophaga sedimenti]|uniref:hypothetical protein n=1 Tax=Chitinophaga sedimenti TaxID=2033606 RepID=UPI0020054684|nr:hypothetical protein [Chitinophaga sedimenti]MCK7554118.1 hypothetical protein [Chitinophaga sedimenti]